jgi:hypothetical protein
VAQAQLKQLLLLKLRSTSSLGELRPEDIAYRIPDVPASWLLPVLDIRPRQQREPHVGVGRVSNQESSTEQRRS